MALRWCSIVSSGSIAINDNQKNVQREFNLSVAPRSNAAALLMVATRKVDYERNFFTINLPNLGAQGNLSFQNAEDQDGFVSSVFRSGDHWIQQTHRIPPGLLKAGTNRFGIHART